MQDERYLSFDLFMQHEKNRAWFFHQITEKVKNLEKNSEKPLLIGVKEKYAGTRGIRPFLDKLRIDCFPKNEFLLYSEYHYGNEFRRIPSYINNAENNSATNFNIVLLNEVIITGRGVVRWIKKIRTHYKKANIVGSVLLADCGNGKKPKEYEALNTIALTNENFKKWRGSSYDMENIYNESELGGRFPSSDLSFLFTPPH
jgi:hypothetical protein